MNETRLRTYICEQCHGTFVEISDDQKQQEEYKELFLTEWDQKETVRVCHDCWVAMMEWGEAEGLFDSSWRKFK